MQVSTAIQNSQVELNFMHSKCGKMGDCIRPVLKGARFEVFSHSRGTGSDIVAYESNKKRDTAEFLASCLSMMWTAERLHKHHAYMYDIF